MAETIEFVKKPAIISTDFELLDSKLKMDYIISNILMYNEIGALIKECKGTFGTGYPFYAIKRNKDGSFEGALPIIDEQLRYNKELIDQADASGFREWGCARCLQERQFTMPDLKQICKVCPNMADVLKPRKLINRLPDMDMWMVYNPSDFEQMKQSVSIELAKQGFKTSDVDPVHTIYELEKIMAELKGGKVPHAKLPIDTHLIDRLTLYTLTSQVPEVLDYCYRKGEKPFLPIHPDSLRKTWQKDDEAYNYIFDYLFSFTEFKLDDGIQSLLDETRKEIANKYSMETLKQFLNQVASPSVQRRIATARPRDGKSDKSVLEERFEERVESWREL